MHITTIITSRSKQLRDETAREQEARAKTDSSQCRIRELESNSKIPAVSQVLIHRDDLEISKKLIQTQDMADK